MKMPLRRLFAAFLCLSLTLPAGASPELSRRTLRAGLEGTVESELSAGLEEPRDLTEEILGRHPFKVRVLSGSEKDRAQLFLYDPVHNGFLDAGGPRAVSLGAQHRMSIDKVSESLLLRTLEAGIPIPPWEMMSLVGSRTDEEFEWQIQWLLGRRYAGDTEEGMRIIQQLRAEPTSDLLKRAAELRQPDETVPEPLLLLLALLYKLREYAQDAYSINHIQSVQMAVAFLANNGDYQALKESVNRALENRRGNPRRSSQTGIQNVSEIESVDLWQVKEGNTSVVYRVEVTIKGRPDPVFFALNIAKDATAATKAVEAAWLTLNFYYETDPSHVMEPYLCTEFELALGEGARATRRSIGVLAGEWVPGDEIHLYVRPDGYPDMRIWTNQQSPGEPLTGEETDLVWQETVRMQARYSPLILADEGTLPMVQPVLIALNAGDLVWYRDSSGVSGPVLIWPWSGPYDLPMEASEFLVSSLLVSAVDQETSAAVRQNFWGQPERALEIVREEFSEKLRAAARAADVSDADAFAHAQWRAVVRDAAGWVIPRYFEDPGLFLETWFFNPAEAQQANAQLRAAQTALQAHLASLVEALSSGLEEPTPEEFETIASTLFDAVAQEVIARKSAGPKSRVGGMHFKMQDGAILVSTITASKTLRRHLPFKTALRLVSIVRNQDNHIPISVLFQSALAKTEPPARSLKRLLWESGSAQTLREQGIWMLEIQVQKGAGTGQVDGIYDRDSALLAFRALGILFLEKQKVRMNVVWSAFLAFQHHVMKRAAEDSFFRFLTVLQERFPEQDREGDPRQAARVWETAYPVFQRVLDLETLDEWAALFRAAADQLMRDTLPPPPGALDFSPQAKLSVSQDPSVAGLKKNRLDLVVPGNLEQGGLQAFLVKALQDKTLPISTTWVTLSLSEIIDNTNEHDYGYQPEWATRVTLVWDNQEVRVVLENEAFGFFSLEKALADQSFEDPADIAARLVNLDKQQAVSGSGRSGRGIGLDIIKRAKRDGALFLENETFLSGGGTRRILVFQNPAPPAAGLEEPVRFSNRTMSQVATLLEDHPQALLAVSLPPRNRNDRREVFREMAPSSAEAAERFLNKIPRALREQAKRFSYDVEILLPANESQPAQIRVTAYRPFPSGEPTQIFRGLTGSQLFPILAEFRPYPIRVIRPADARASAEQRILEIPAEENPIRTVKATVQKFLSDKELAPEDDQVRYTLLVFENPTGEEGLAVAAEVRIRAPEFPPVSASAGLEERVFARILHINADASFTEVVASAPKEMTVIYRLYREFGDRNPGIARISTVQNFPSEPADASDLLKSDLLGFFGVSARDRRYFVQVSDKPDQPKTVWIDIAPAKETVTLSIPGDLNQATIPEKILEALKDKPLPVKAALVTFFLSEIIGNINEHDYGYKKELSTRVTITWDSKEVQVVLEDQSSTDPDDVAEEILAQADAGQAAATSGRTGGKVASIMMKRARRAGELLLKEETHTPGQGTRRVLVFKNPSAAGLEENNWESKFRRSARILQDRGWFLNADSFMDAFLKAEDFLRQDLALFEQRTLQAGGADRLRRKWRKAIENKKRFLPAFSALMEHLSEPASENHALTVANWKSSENGYRATLEYRFENQLVRALLTVNRNTEFPILRIYLSRKISGGNLFLPIAQVRIGKDREPDDLLSRPPLHLDILIAPERRSWLEHQDLMPVWSAHSTEDPAQILKRFQDFLASLGSYLTELPAAGLEEDAQKFKEAYTVRRADNPAQFVTMIDTLDHVQDRGLDRFVQAAQLFIPRWKEAAEGDFSRFLKPEERPTMLKQMRRVVHDGKAVVRPGSWALDPNEEAAVDSLVSQLLGEPVAPYKALYREYMGGRDLDASEQERLYEYYSDFIHLTTFLKYRDYAEAVSKFFERLRSQWRTPEVREKFIPEALATFLGSYSLLPGENPSHLASEAKAMDGLVGFLGQARVIKTWPWPKDRALALPGFVGLVQSKGIRQKVSYDLLDPPPSYPKAKFSEGGAFVSGEGNTPFILYSDGADPEEIRGAQAVLPEMFPELSGLSFYRLPGGFTTFRHNGQEFLIGNNHLDTVLNFIPASMTKNGKTKIVVDPLYYREIESLEEFQRFVAEQGDSFDLVLVEETERHFNPANFALVFRKGESKPTLLLNYAPETTQKMGLKPGAYFTLSEENAFRKIALLGGSLGCLCGLDLLQASKAPAAGLEEISDVVAKFTQIPPAAPGSVGDAALVFTNPATFDLAALAVRWGWTVAVAVDGPEAARLEEFLDALSTPKGRYAVGTLKSSRLLDGVPGQILIEDRPKGFQILGLRWDDLPPPVAGALESALATLDRARQA